MLCSLASKEGHPGEAEIMRIHKHVLDEQIGAAAMLWDKDSGRI